MQYDHIIIRYGELTLKSGNRNIFTKRLKKNIKFVLRGLSNYHIQTKRDRMYIKLDEGANVDAITSRLKQVFGIQSLSAVVRVDLNLDLAKSAALELIHQREYKGKTFKVSCKRPNKNFEYNTNQINQQLGAYILTNTENLTVNVKQPDFIVHLDVRSEGIFIFTDIIQGAGGLPVGSASKALLMLSGGIDSPVAMHLMHKRGVVVEAIHFQSPPFTSEKAKEKVLSLAAKLAERVGAVHVHLVPFTELQSAVVKNIPENYTMTATRRMMLKVAERVAQQRECLAIVTGESLGQVASQTLESMHAINAVTNMPVLRPLLTFDKTEIIKIAEEIGTFDISNLPYEDCCTIFTPKSPKTKPKLEKMEKYENYNDYQSLIDDCIMQTESFVVFKDHILTYADSTRDHQLNPIIEDDFSELL